MLYQRNIKLMYAISFFQGMVFYGSIATLYRQACGLSLFQITLIESIFSVACILLELPWGIVADWLGYRRTILLCSTLFFVSKIIFWQAESFGGFLCERLLLSVVISGLSGVDDTILFLSCEKGQAQRVFSIYGYFGTLGMILASVCFSLFLSENFRAAAFWTVVSYAIAAALSFGLKEVGNPAAPTLSSQIAAFRPGSFLKNRFVIFLIAMAITQEVYQLIIVFFSQPLYAQAGWSTATMGTVHIVLQLLSMSVVFSDALTKRWKPRLFLPLLLVFSSLCAFLLSFSLPSALLFLGVAGIQTSCSLLGPLQANIQNEAITEQNRATALSAQSLLMRGIAIGVNLSLGRLSESSLSASLSASGLLLLGALFCVLLWQRSQPRSTQ